MIPTLTTEVPTIDELRATGRRPRVHPNGFVQFDLEEPIGNGDYSKGHSGGSRRLHIWPDNDMFKVFKQASDNTWHDHVFNMRSTVLAGTLMQREYDVRLDHCGFPTHEIWMAKYSCRHSSLLEPTGVTVCVAETEPFYIEPGGTYFQQAFTFHDTNWIGLTVTLMEKEVVFKGNPRVLVKVGEGVDNDFDREAESEDNLWDIVAAGLEAAHKEANS